MQFNKILLILFLLKSFSSTDVLGQYNKFPSFLTSNATLAVIVDRDYKQTEGGNILKYFQQIFTDVVQRHLNNGGINVKYYSWKGIRLKKDTLAAMTVMDCKETWKFFEATRTVRVLHIALTEADCPRLPYNEALMIPTVTQGEEFSQLILDAKIQNLITWPTVNLLIDESLINQDNQHILKVVHESITYNVEPMSVIFYSINNRLMGQKKRKALRKILQMFADHPDTRRQFMIFSKFYEDIIEIANLMEMFHVHNEWLFFILDGASFREFNVTAVTQNLGEGANIAFAVNEVQEEEECKDSLNCTITELSLAFVKSISQLILEEQTIYGETSDEEWEAIRYTKEEKQVEILNYMRSYLKRDHLCMNCLRWKFVTALTWGKTQEQHKNILSSFDNRNKNFEFVNVGYWMPSLGFVTQELLFPHVTHHFRNITVNIVTVHNPPWQIIEKDNNGQITQHSGIVMDIIKELSSLLNFTYKLYDANNLTAEITENHNDEETLPGSLTYLIPYQVVASMQTNKYLMSAVACTIDDPDKKSFNYTIPISTQTYSFISRKPKEVSRIYLFIAPFKNETWLCLIAIIFITSPLLYLINQWVPVSYMRVEGFCNLKNCFWYIYGSLLQQGGLYLPQADSGRVIIGIWWIVVIVLITSYSGNLVAFLTFPRYQRGLNYVFQVFKYNQNKELGLRGGTFFEKYISFSDRNDYHKYLSKAIIYNNTRQENMAAVIKGERINIDWRINLQQNIQKQFDKDKVCSLSMSKEDFVDETIALIVPRDSPYLSLINSQIYRLHQMGFIERWHKMNLPPTDKCQNKGSQTAVVNHKVNMDDMQGCFLVLFLGFIIAVFAILLELWYYRWQIKKHLNRILFST